jgi:hypothetical protein
MKIRELVTNKDGTTSESRLWVNVGKAVAVWLLWKHSDAILQHWETLATLLSVLIVPELLKRMIESKYPANAVPVAN